MIDNKIVQGIYNRENLLQGKENLQSNFYRSSSKRDYIKCFAAIEVLIERAKLLNMWDEIIYPMQNLQEDILLKIS